MVFLGPAPTHVDAEQKYPKGEIGYDNAGNEYIYLPGVSSCAARDAVVFDEDYATTRLAPDEVGPVAIATAAVDATTKFGWFGRKGVFAVNSDTVAADAILFIDTGAGRVDDASVAGDTIIGLYSMTTDTYSGAANITKCYANYPQVTNNNGLST
ncbi:MAG TPA: hypothetical protein VEA69_01460 [Tepidisphaeraceae bacterium]|nr:hypothetical protein [Tepidisphaeraceae bacterium]